MRKIVNIDGAASYAQTGCRPLVNVWSKRYRVNPDWFDAHFTELQKKILNTRGYTIRPHPRHNPTLELFINETDLTKRDWTVIRLLF